MKCESCKINEFEIEESADNGQAPYRLCRPCQKRLVSHALRPLEFFNLTSIHGHTHLLHDDFYDENGNAEQPEIKVIDAKKYPFPRLSEISNDLKKLVDFACVQYFTTNEVIDLIKQQDNQSVLNYLDIKINYNRAINYKIYEIVAKVLGKFAADWIRLQWNNRKENEFRVYTIAISNCLPIIEGFEIITKEIEKSDEKFLLENALSLLYFQSNKTLAWIEKNKDHIKNISTSWGTLAAASEFDWQTANKWLDANRPLSLIALDALYFCTTKGDRSNQALWLIENPPKLLNAPSLDIIATRVQAYLINDNVVRTRNAVDAIISNLFETTN